MNRKTLLLLGILINSIIIICLSFNLLNTNKKINLKELDYYSNHDLTNCSLEEIFELDNCLVYFYELKCQACQSTNQYIYSFIEKGFNQNVEIYFVDVSNREDLWGETDLNVISLDNFRVEVTPTMLCFRNKEVKCLIGNKEIYEILSKYVN